METPSEATYPQSVCTGGQQESSTRVRAPGSHWAVDPMSYHEVWSEPPNTLAFFSTEGKVTERCLGRGTAQSRWHLEKSL